MVAAGVHVRVGMRRPPINANNPPTPSSFAKATEDKWLRRGKKEKHSMKSKTKNKLVAFVKEAIRAAVAAIMGVAGAALAGCTAVTTPADSSHTIGVVGFGVPFGIQVNK